MPAPYMVERFNAAARSPDFRFEAWFSTRAAAERTWTWTNRPGAFGIATSRASVAGNTRSRSRRRCSDATRPDLIVSLYASTAFLVGWRLARLRGAQTAFWAEVTFDSWVRRRRWKETLKKIVLPRARAILTAGRDGADFVKRYGVPHDRIFIVPHVIDFERYARRARSLAARAYSRGAPHDIRLRRPTLAREGVAYLIDAFASLHARAPQRSACFSSATVPTKNGCGHGARRSAPMCSSWTVRGSRSLRSATGRTRTWRRSSPVRCASCRAPSGIGTAALFGDLVLRPIPRPLWPGSPSPHGWRSSGRSGPTWRGAGSSPSSPAARLLLGLRPRRRRRGHGGLRARLPRAVRVVPSAPRKHRGAADLRDLVVVRPRRRAQRSGGVDRPRLRPRALADRPRALLRVAPTAACPGRCRSRPLAGMDAARPPGAAPARPRPAPLPLVLFHEARLLGAGTSVLNVVEPLREYGWSALGWVPGDGLLRQEAQPTGSRRSRARSGP